MARSFGTTGASALIRSATAAYNKTAAFNDASAAYEYDLSPKTQADVDKYNAYLGKRLDQTKNSDPTKALSLQRTATSAYRSFNSAEIGRATTAVKFGDISSRDKYAQLTRLQQAASANGDDNLAQSLYSQMASLGVQIQNEDKAAQAKNEADQRKAEAAYKKGYSQQAAKLQDGIKELNAAKASGAITPADYNDRMSQLYMGNPNAKENDPARYGLVALTQEAAKATGDPDLTYQNKLDGWAADKQVQGFVNGNKALAGANGNLFGQVITKGSDGTYSFKDRPNNEITGNQLAVDKNGNKILDANGHASTIPTFAAPQAFQDEKGGINGFQYATAIDEKTGQPKPGAGAQAIRQIDKSQLNYDDPSGVPYFYNESGQKKYVGKDSENGKAIMGNSPDVVTGPKIDNSPLSALDFTAPKNVLKGEAAFGLTLAKQNPLINGAIKIGTAAYNALFNKAGQAQEQMKQSAILKAQQAAHAAQIRDQQYQARQAQLLPVFRAPAPPPPKPVATPSQYKLPPLPAPVPLGTGNTPADRLKVPASTGSVQKDLNNFGRSYLGI